MPRHGVRYEDVKEACQRIIASGCHVTLAAVRAEIGSGSYSTICGYVRQWRERHREAVHAAEIRLDLKKALQQLGRYDAEVKGLQAALTAEEERTAVAEARLADKEEVQ